MPRKISNPQVKKFSTLVKERQPVPQPRPPAASGLKPKPRTQHAGAENLVPIPKGTVLNPVGACPGKRLITRVKELLCERSKLPNGEANTRFDDVANVFVQQMESGSFVHMKEYIDREEGKVPTRLSDAEGKNIKLYVGMPVSDDDPEAP